MTLFPLGGTVWSTRGRGVTAATTVTRRSRQAATSPSIEDSNPDISVKMRA